jgi:hypothetical protein
MKLIKAFLGSISLCAVVASPAAAQGMIAMDKPVTVNTVDTVCTGIGGDAQHDPRWRSYPIRVEFSNEKAQYLSGAHVELSTADDKPLAALDCAGPWVLFKLGPGTYKIRATLTGQQGGGTSSATFSPPSKGQKRIVLGFRLQPNQ